MKKLAPAVLVVMVICGAAFGAEQITAEEAFRIAARSAGDPIVGIWRMHPIHGGKIAHMAIVPNNTNRRRNWNYLGVMLEDGFQIKKGGIKIALRKTSFANTFDVILSNRASKSGAVYKDGSGLAFLKGTLLDMSHVEVPSLETVLDDTEIYRYAPITHMIKIRYFQMQTTDDFDFNPSGLYLDGLKIKTIETGSPAEQSGLKLGDEITEINGRPADEKTVKDIDERLVAGRSVVIVYERGGDKDMVTLKYGLTR